MPKTSTVPKEARLRISASDLKKAILAPTAYAVLVDQNEFRLPNAQWEAFCERLDASPRPLPALRQLFSEAEPYDG